MGPHHALHYAVSSPGRHYYHRVFFCLYLLLMEFFLAGEMEVFTLETLEILTMHCIL